MFSTKNLVLNPSDVPSYWVFQYYLNLSEPLIGQDIKIKSIFNPLEKTPSFCVYVDKSVMQYKFKDFSTGKSGTKVDLVKLMFNIDFPTASRKIINDYNAYVKTSDFKTQTFKAQPKWEVQFIKETEWTEADASFWLQFNIGKKMLEKYNVKPIEYYNLVKEENYKIKSLKIEGRYMYGYYDKEDKVYKIYQPYSKHKFHKVSNHLQGYDQLKYDQPYLIICSSLKDAMCLASIGYNIETIAPDSENTMIKPHVIEYLKKKYKKVITLLDNDEAGIKAMDKYKSVYKIDGLVLPICKDISDAVKKLGVKQVHTNLKPLLKDILNK
tara:strand:+ start:2616 stop:3590 length:975 start_codon:yes stop_codon:yes gene_type:complete